MGFGKGLLPGGNLVYACKDRYVPLNWVGQRLPNVLKSGLIILENSLNMGHRENAMGPNTNILF